MRILTHAPLRSRPAGKRVGGEVRIVNERRTRYKLVEQEMGLEPRTRERCPMGRPIRLEGENGLFRFRLPTGSILDLDSWPKQAVNTDEHSRGGAGERSWAGNLLITLIDLLRTGLGWLLHDLSWARVGEHRALCSTELLLGWVIHRSPSPSCFTASGQIPQRWLRSAWSR
jgi:hypothetical protein